LCDHRLRESANLDLQVEDIESTDALAADVVVTDVPVVAANALDRRRNRSVGSRTVRMIAPTVTSSRASSKARESSKSVWGERRCGPGGD